MGNSQQQIFPATLGTVPNSTGARTSDTRRQIDVGVPLSPWIIDGHVEYQSNRPNILRIATWRPSLPGPSLAQRMLVTAAPKRGDVPNGIRWSIRRHARWRPRSDCASCRKDDRVTTIMEASEAWVLPERPPALLGVCVPIAAAIRPSFGYRAGAGAVLGPSPFACQASSQAEDRQSASPGLTATSCRLMCQMVCRCSRAAAIVHTIWGRHRSACHAADEHDRSTQPRP